MNGNNPLCHFYYVLCLNDGYEAIGVTIKFGFVHLVVNVNWPDHRKEIRKLRLLIHIINPVDITKLSCYTPHRRRTTVSLETYPSIHRSDSLAILWG